MVTTSPGIIPVIVNVVCPNDWPLYVNVKPVYVAVIFFWNILACAIGLANW